MPTSQTMPTSHPVGRVGAVVALKPLAQAKSRLDLPAPLRRRLAWTMALDTVAALTAALPDVVVVSDEPGLQHRLRSAGVAALVVAEPAGAGLNTAFRHGAASLAARGVDRVLAAVGDLPALRPGSVAEVVEAAAGHRRAFVADAAGVGSTLLIADATDLDPRFQGRSAAAHHATGAVPLFGAGIPGPADARRDVDTEPDLLAAATLGLGRATRALVDAGSGRLGTYLVVTATDFTRATGGTDVPVAVTESGHRVLLPPAALGGGLRQIRLGQRLHAVATGDRVLSAWL